MRSIDLSGHTVGVQLYGSEPNLPLIDYLHSVGATPLPVSPYVYADAIDDAQVHALIARMAQVNRLFKVGEMNALQTAFARVQVAAVGPVVRDALAQQGVVANCMPEDSFFMKPLVSSMEGMTDAPHDPDGSAAS